MVSDTGVFLTPIKNEVVCSVSKSCISASPISSPNSSPISLLMRSINCDEQFSWSPISSKSDNNIHLFKDDSFIDNNNNEFKNQDISTYPKKTSSFLNNIYRGFKEITTDLNILIKSTGGLNLVSLSSNITQTGLSLIIGASYFSISFPHCMIFTIIGSVSTSVFIYWSMANNTIPNFLSPKRVIVVSGIILSSCLLLSGCSFLSSIYSSSVSISPLILYLIGVSTSAISIYSSVYLADVGGVLGASSTISNSSSILSSSRSLSNINSMLITGVVGGVIYAGYPHGNNALLITGGLTCSTGICCLIGVSLIMFNQVSPIESPFWILDSYRSRSRAHAGCLRAQEEVYAMYNKGLSIPSKTPLQVSRIVDVLDSKSRGRSDIGTALLVSSLYQIIRQLSTLCTLRWILTSTVPLISTWLGTKVFTSLLTFGLSPMWRLYIATGVFVSPFGTMYLIPDMSEMFFKIAEIIVTESLGCSIGHFIGGPIIELHSLSFKDRVKVAAISDFMSTMSSALLPPILLLMNNNTSTIMPLYSPLLAITLILTFNEFYQKEKVVKLGPTEFVDESNDQSFFKYQENSSQYKTLMSKFLSQMKEIPELYPA